MPFNGESPFSCQVYFINKVVSMDVRWGTSSPMMLEDAEYGRLLPVRANGQFAVKVIDGKKLLLNLVGTIDKFDQSTLKEYFKGILTTNIKDYIAKELTEKHVSFLKVHAHLKEISNGIGNLLEQEFSQYGIALVNFYVNEIAPPEDDPSVIRLKQALDDRSDMKIKGYNYQQEQAFDVLRTAAANEGSSANIMGAGMGLGMGLNLGGVFGNTMSGAMGNISPNMQPTDGADRSTVCPVCKAEIPYHSKFCLKCGTKVEIPSEENVVCPKCSAQVPKGKFCLECGALLENKCRQCGASLSLNAKFCMECGSKVE